MMSARRMLRKFLLVQALAGTAIALAAWRWFGAAPWAAVALGLASVVLVRLAINMNNFLVSACFASPTPPEFRIGWAGRVRLLAEEFKSSMLHTSWFMPRATACMRVYESSLVPAHVPPHAPVLLVHGYGCNSGYWSYLIPRLDRARISHASVDLEPVLGDIDGYVPLVQQAVEELCRATGAGQVALVAHSMGGLVVRAWMRVHGTARVARVITLGSPHHGTGMAKFGRGPNVVQMRCNRGVASDWLQELGRSEDPATRALITSIYTHHDNIVSPQTSSHLPGARNIEFGGVGHVALGCNARVLDAVMGELAALSPRSMPHTPAPSLLLVDDDAFMRELLADAVQGQGWRVLTAASGAEALAVLAREPVAVVVSDHVMPGLRGAALLEQVRQRYPGAYRILLSGSQDEGAVEITSALASGAAHRFLAKPWSGAVLLAALHEAFGLQQARAAL
ncbi:alpha/beta fold hydrolase [Massilia niabensis]|uniref:Alpha/beta fold hydrolase n=1 Tax=Massilia niabensis TaxID=544910 RepID=A0ABW0L231_9BURK